ncbi:hypothetical protein HDV06_003855 [Boothiomyces sp. JEL0866]|nr:hypothetical protein HDV06_003855 [Boothiomyces sp. JEL0866]
MFQADIQQHISKEEVLKLAERAAIEIDSAEKFTKEINAFASMVSHVHDSNKEPINSLVSNYNRKPSNELDSNGPTMDPQSLSKLSISDGYFVAK